MLVKGSHLETIVTHRRNASHGFRDVLRLYGKIIPGDFIGLSSRYAATVGVLIILAGWWQWPRYDVVERQGTARCTGRSISGYKSRKGF